jgi:hypothetical protein
MDDLHRSAAIVTTPSRTWSLILALQAQLATIRVTNGYITELGAHIWTTDSQRSSDDALGLMIYSEPIVGPGLDRERPGKPVRDFTLLLECAIGTDLDDAQQQIHCVIEDIDNCLATFAKQPAALGALQCTAMHVVDIAILDRPEGAAVIAMQARVVARYFR